MSTSAGEDFGTALGQFLQIIFSPIFPLGLITLCGVSFLLSVTFGMPHFALFFLLALGAVEYARGHLWAMLTLIAIVLGALPLAWVAYKEHVTKVSAVIGHWVFGGLWGAGVLWLARVWSFTGSGFQLIIFALLLFTWWMDVCDMLLGTVKLIALARPQPGREVVDAQKAHGDARLAGEDEAISLLNPKR